MNSSWKYKKQKKPRICEAFLLLSGEIGIRTPGPVTVNSFQDCRNRPLCHFSNGHKISIFFFLLNKKVQKIL